MRMACIPSIECQSALYLWPSLDLQQAMPKIRPEFYWPLMAILALKGQADQQRLTKLYAPDISPGACRKPTPSAYTTMVMACQWRSTRRSKFMCQS